MGPGGNVDGGGGDGGVDGDGGDTRDGFALPLLLLLLLLLRVAEGRGLRAHSPWWAERRNE